MLSDLQQRSVWEGWLSAEIRANYFADLAGRFQRNQTIITWATLVFSSGAFVTLVSDWLPANLAWIRPLLALATAALSLWSLTTKNERNAIECSDLHFQWNMLVQAYERLWDDMYSDAAPNKLRELMEKGAALSKTGNSFPNKTKLMLKWQLYVEEQHKAQLAVHS